MDKPRQARQSLTNREYISFWADEAPRIVCGRSPIECYTDFMSSFRTAFANDIGEAIEEVVIGCGPCGELRFDSCVVSFSWVQAKCSETLQIMKVRHKIAHLAVDCEGVQTASLVMQVRVLS